MEGVPGAAGISVHLVGLCQYRVPHGGGNALDAAGHRLRRLSAVTPGFSYEACPDHADTVHYDL
ncbi:hypothetical protein D3C87_1748240 [compost metagenome]